MIIYITGYGRSGSTALSRVIEKKLNACNLGELKYLYRNGKDDLLDPYWIRFKKKNKDVLADPAVPIKKFDNILGWIRWRQRKKYQNQWMKIFDRIGVNPNEEVIIDSSKTAMDVFMRGIYLSYSFEEICFVQPKRNIIDVVKSLLKGKNPNIERREKKSLILRIFHVLLVGLPHMLITKLLTQIYQLYGLKTINIENLEAEVNEFIETKCIENSNCNKDLPMVYGNRNRNKKLFLLIILYYYNNNL